MKTFIVLTILLTSAVVNGENDHEKRRQNSTRGSYSYNGATSEAQLNSNTQDSQAKDIENRDSSTINSNAYSQKTLSSTPRTKQGYARAANQQNRQTSPIKEEVTTTTEEVTGGPEIYVQPKEKEDAFDWKLSQEVFKEQARTKSNVIISPVSIKLLLTILAEAAEQDVASLTREELKEVLPFDHSLNSTRLYFKKILDSFKVTSENVTVNVGTRGFVRNDIGLRQKFTSQIAYNYDVEMVKLNFINSTLAAESVNDWVKNITKGKISNLVDAETVESCVMLLINAIYFKGVWKIPFETTISSEFFSTPTNPQKKQFIQQTGDYYYNYNTELKVRFLRLPYEGKRFSMFVILPFEKDGLAQVMEKLNSTVVRDVVDNMRLMQVKATLPKFKFETSMNLNQVVKNLGITEIFKDSATLPHLISNGRGMKVSSIIQKAGITVDEKGSEAFAATEIDLVDKFGGDPREFLADHPFLFYIEDDTTGAKLFAGVINNPEFSI